MSQGQGGLFLANQVHGCIVVPYSSDRFIVKILELESAVVPALPEKQEAMLLSRAGENEVSEEGCDGGTGGVSGEGRRGEGV